MVFNLKLSFKLKIDPKMCTFKNLEENLKKLLATLSYTDMLYLEMYTFCVQLVFISNLKFCGGEGDIFTFIINWL